MDVYAALALLATFMAWTTTLWVARGRYDAVVHEKDTQLWEWERNDRDGEIRDLQEQLQAHLQVEEALVDQAERDRLADAEPDPARSRELLYPDPAAAEPLPAAGAGDPTA